MTMLLKIFSFGESDCDWLVLTRDGTGQCDWSSWLVVPIDMFLRKKEDTSAIGWGICIFAYDDFGKIF